MLNFIWAAMILLAVIYGAISGNMSEVTDAALDSAGEAVSLCITMAGVVALWMGLMEIAQKAGLVRKLTRGIMPFLKFMFPRIPKGHPAEGYIATNIIANVLGLGWACTPAGLKAMEALAQLEAERGNPEYLEDKKTESRSMQREVAWENPAGKGFGQQVQGRTDNGTMRGNTGGESDRKHGSFWKGESFGGTGREFRQGYRRTEVSGGGCEKSGGRRASNEMCTFLILNISSLQLIPVNMIAYRSQYGSANPTAIIAPAIAATLISTLVAIVYCKIKDRAGRSSAFRQSGTVSTFSEKRNDRGGKVV